MMFDLQEDHDESRKDETQEGGKERHGHTGKKGKTRMMGMRCPLKVTRKMWEIVRRS